MRLSPEETKDIDIVFSFGPVLAGKGELQIMIRAIGTNRVTGEPVILYTKRFHYPNPYKEEDRPPFVFLNEDSIS